MSVEDKSVVVRSTEIPGMQITFQGPLSPDGKGMAFVVAIDATTSREDMDELLDRITAAHRRQAAVEELPIVKQSLHANLRLLATTRREMAIAVARQQGNVERMSAGRRIAREPTPSDISAVAQHDQRIVQIEGQIEGARARLPYLEAIIAGREPPELFPDQDNVRMAAE